MRGALIAVLFTALLVPHALGAGRELAPRGVSPTAYPATNGSVAFAGDRFLTVWIEDRGILGRHLMGMFRDANGARITPFAFPVIESFQSHAPLQLIGTGDSYALFWVGPSNTMQLTDIGLDGLPTRTTAIDVPFHTRLTMAWNGTRFLVHRGGEGYLMTRSGEVVRHSPLWDYVTAVTVPLPAVHIAGDGAGFIAAIAAAGGVTAYRIAEDGAVTSYTIDTEPGRDAFISATRAGELLVVYAVAAEVAASVVTTAGEIRPLGVLATSQLPMSVVHVRRAGDAHLVTYLTRHDSDRGIATLILHADGTVTPAQDRAPISQFSSTETAAASSAQSTLTVYSAQGHQPLLLDVVTGNDAALGEVEVVSMGRTRHSQPILANGGGSVFAAWSNLDGNLHSVRTASLAPDGTTVRESTLAAPALVAARDVAWNGSEFLVVQERFGTLMASRIAADGTDLDEQQRIRLGGIWETAPNASAVWAGDRWVVVWNYGGLTLFRTVRDGHATEEKQLELGDYSASEAALAFNGSTLLVVWSSTIGGQSCPYGPCGGNGGTKVGMVARITLDGVLDGTPLPIPAADTYAVATSGSEFFVLGGATATIVDSSGRRVVTSRPIFNWPAAGDVTWDGSSYAVALRYRGVQWHLSAAHFDRKLIPVGPPRGTPTLAPDEDVPPSIAGALIAVQEGDLTNGMAAVVYREDDLAPLPAPPPAPHNVRVTPTGDGQFEITWEESPGAELYRVTVLDPYGRTASVIDVPATAPRSAIARYSAARVIAFNAGGASDPQPRRSGVRR